MGKSAAATALFGQSALLFTTDRDGLHARGEQCVELSSDLFEPGFHKDFLELRAAMVTAWFQSS